jgi:hypothetical protein
MAYGWLLRSGANKWRPMAIVGGLAIGSALVTATILAVLPDRAIAQDDGLPLPKPPGPRPPAPPAPPAADDPLEGLVKPDFTKWPLLPPPLPQDHLAFCSEQERLDYDRQKFDPVYKLAHEKFLEVIVYSLKLANLVQKVSNEISALEQKSQRSADEDKRLAKLKSQLAALKTADRDGNIAVNDAYKTLSFYEKHVSVIRDASIIGCTCPGVEMMKGLVISRIDSRGRPHMPPSREFEFIIGKPGENEYYDIMITVRPGLRGGCQPDGKPYVSFALFAGEGVRPEYFNIRLLDGHLPMFGFFPENLMTNMKVTFNNGASVESESWAQPIEFPEGAKRVEKLEMWLWNGGRDADMKLTTVVLSWP